jgi:hypothetical protein
MLRRIDRRVAVEGDSDTRRFQKVLVVVVAFIGSISRPISPISPKWSTR